MEPTCHPIEKEVHLPNLHSLIPNFPRWQGVFLLHKSLFTWAQPYRLAINPAESYWSKWIIPPIFGLNIRKSCSWNHPVFVFYLVTACISCQALDINWLEIPNDSPNPLKMSSTPLLVSKKPSKDLACHWSGTSKSNMRFSEMEEIMHQLMGSSSHHLQGLMNPRWCRMSSINSSSLQIGCCCEMFW